MRTTRAAAPMMAADRRSAVFMVSVWLWFSVAWAGALTSHTDRAAATARGSCGASWQGEPAGWCRRCWCADPATTGG